MPSSSEHELRGERAASRIKRQTSILINELPQSESKALTSIYRTKTITRRSDESPTTLLAIIIVVVVVSIGLVVGCVVAAARKRQEKEEAGKNRKSHRPLSTVHQGPSSTAEDAPSPTVRFNENISTTSNGQNSGRTQAERPDIATLMQRIGYLEAQMANMRQQEELRRQSLTENRSNTPNVPLPHPLAESEPRLEADAESLRAPVGSIPVPVLLRGEP